MKNMLLMLIILNFISIQITQSQDNNKYPGNVNGIIVNYEETKPRLFEFRAYSREHDLESISNDLIGEHPFGIMIAKKIYLLKDLYTSEVSLIPGNPQTRTLIKKPVIYETVRRIERYLKQSVRKEEIDADQAEHNLNKVLDVALNILTADTRDFEKALKSLDDYPSKIELFMKRVTLRY